MTVYVDELRGYPNITGPAARVGKRWCHLWADGDVDELHAFARGLGVKRRWYQGPRRHFGHYDLTPLRRRHAVEAGATEVRLKDYLRRRRA